MRLIVFVAFVSIAFAGCDVVQSFLFPKNEASTRDNLEALRDKLSNALPNNHGRPVNRLQDVAPSVPAAETGHHFRNDQVINACTDGKDTSQLKDTGGWAYCGIPDNPNFGNLVVDCTHNDSTGKPWYSY